jgi:hypothetical protein
MKQENLTVVSPQLLSYFAGIVDGDGCIRIKKSAQKLMISPKYEVVLQVKMTYEPLIKLLAAVFNGTYKLTPPSSRTGKSLYCFAVSGPKAEVTINTLLPYLRTKKQQAKLCLQLRELQKQSKFFQTKKTDFAGKFSLSDGYLEQCESLYQQCKTLKITGENTEIEENYISSHIDIAYLSGIIDAEGTVTIKKVDRYKKSTVNAQYHGLVDVHMADRYPISLLKSTFGGVFHIPKPKNGYKPLFLYRAKEKQAENLLKLVLPHLTVKKEQAETVLALRNLQKDWRSHVTKVVGERIFPNKYGTERIIKVKSFSDEYLTMCEDFLLKCRELNQAGISVD